MCYRGVAPPVRSFSDFACFVALFPQLIAGPIVRYNTIADQLVSRSHTFNKFASGVALFYFGLREKTAAGQYDRKSGGRCLRGGSAGNL